VTKRKPGIISGDERMFTLAIVDISKYKDWWIWKTKNNGDTIDVSDSYAHRLLTRGGVVAIEHYRLVTAGKKVCGECGSVKIEKKKVLIKNA